MKLKLAGLLSPQMSTNSVIMVLVSNLQLGLLDEKILLMKLVLNRALNFANAISDFA